MVEKWYGTVEQGTNKGILVVVTTGKDGALTGGPDFMKVCPSEPLQRAGQLMLCHHS